MEILITLLVLLLLFDHVIKNKRLNLLVYKNDHRFDVVVAIRFYHPEIERFIDMAEKSKHNFIFININESIYQSDYPNATIIEMHTDEDPNHEGNMTEILSQSYKLGYKNTSSNFLLFMDSNIVIENMRILDFMANNLVEHQLYTIKEVIDHKSVSDGQMLFFDFFKDANNPSELVNFHFFAIKRNSYNLMNAEEKVYDAVEDYELDLLKRNITVIHVSHDNKTHYVLNRGVFKTRLEYMLHYLVHRERFVSIKRFLLLLLGLHLFYLIIFLNISYFTPLYLLIVHVALWLVIKMHARHHILTYILLPFHMLFFDGLLTVGYLRRRKHKKHQQTNTIEVTDEDIPTEETLKEK